MNCRTLMERALVVLDSVALSDRQQGAVGALALAIIHLAQHPAHESADLVATIAELMREG